MTPKHFLTTIIDPGLDFLAQIEGAPQPSFAARRFLLAIAQQESGQTLRARYQNHPSIVPGPARGFYQFEVAGVRGVLTHRASAPIAQMLCEFCAVNPKAEHVWRTLEGHDVLATCIARLLIFTDPAALPSDEETAWKYYLRTWRPGKPHPRPWPNNWQIATNTISEYRT